MRAANDDAEQRLHALMVAALAGDAAAYRRFLTELAGFVRAFLRRRLTHAPDDVEDLVQEILLAVHTQRHTYDPAQPITAWLHAIARYKLIDALRRRARVELRTDALDDAHELIAASDAHEAEARRDLDKLLARLPDKQRLPIVYTKLRGMSVAEAARATGLSEAAVKIGVHRGLRRLAALTRRAT